MEPVEMGPSIKEVPYVYVSDPGLLPQVTPDPDEMSGPWQGQGQERRMEYVHEEDEILGKVFDRLRRVMIEFSSPGFEKYPRSPQGLEMVVQDLIREFESAYTKAAGLENDLKIQNGVCESMGTKLDRLTKQNEEFMLDRAAWGREHAEEIKKIQKVYQSEKKDLENEMTLLRQQHEEKVAYIDKTKKKMKLKEPKSLFRSGHEKKNG
jgi:hypothetical protein